MYTSRIDTCQYIMSLFLVRAKFPLDSFDERVILVIVPFNVFDMVNHGCVVLVNGSCDVADCVPMPDVGKPAASMRPRR